METFGKITVYITLVLVTGLIGCNQREAPIAYNVDMEKYRLYDFSDDSMKTMHNRTLQDINQDLVFISAKKGNITVGTGSPMESDISTKERISRNIHIINALVDENKRQIAYLSAELKKYKRGNSDLHQALSKNKKQLRAYEMQLDSFKEELLAREFTEDELNMIIDDLIVESELLRIQADKYRTDLATGYYVCQNRKALRKKGVLVDKGGVLGIGQTTVLNTAASEEDFTQIDIHRVTDIPIYGEKPELVTDHPEGTYEFKKENNMTTYLHIQNPEKFWKTSKYMVVAVR